ncbi:MAG TPA: sugar phosphate isomerase/epimerase family protein [Opitutaceae bacterium]|nr:sugar phosphate isomerase/epimerase family protein [Opitutaceae bacterium]
MNLLKRFLGVASFLGAAVLSHAASETVPLSATIVPPPVPGHPIGWCIRAKPEVFADAKSAGFEYVELAMQDVLFLSDPDFQKLAARLQELQLAALSGYNPIPKDANLLLVGPQTDRVREDKHIQLLLARASALKLRYIILNSGGAWRVPDNFPREQAFAQLANFCGRLADAADHAGLTVLIEPLRSSDTNLITTIAEALKLVETVNRPNFQMMVDYSFLRIQKDNLDDLLKVGPHLRDIHISNPPARTYPMDASESDYASFFRILKQIDYHGGLSVHAGTKSFATEAPRAIAFLRKMAGGLAADPTRP